MKPKRIFLSAAFRPKCRKALSGYSGGLFSCRGCGSACRQCWLSMPWHSTFWERINANDRPRVPEMSGARSLRNPALADGSSLCTLRYKTKNDPMLWILKTRLKTIRYDLPGKNRMIRILVTLLQQLLIFRWLWFSWFFKGTQSLFRGSEGLFWSHT